MIYGLNMVMCMTYFEVVDLAFTQWSEAEMESYVHIKSFQRLFSVGAI